MRCLKFIIYCCVSAKLLFFTELAVADIEFGGSTRFVFNVKDKEKTISIENTGKQSVLVQVALEYGDSGRNSDNLPLALSKPLLKIPAGGKQTVDVLYQGSGLPDDRESYGLVSVLEIPQVAEQPNRLQVVLRHRLKLFFRPALVLKAEEAINQLYWTQSLRSEEALLKANNKSPYYLTLTDVRFYSRQGKRCGNTIGHLMIAPFSTQEVVATDCNDSLAKVVGTLVTDEGSETLQTMQVIAP